MMYTCISNLSDIMRIDGMEHMKDYTGFIPSQWGLRRAETDSEPRKNNPSFILPSEDHDEEPLVLKDSKRVAHLRAHVSSKSVVSRDLPSPLKRSDTFVSRMSIFCWRLALNSHLDRTEIKDQAHIWKRQRICGHNQCVSKAIGHTCAAPCCYHSHPSPFAARARLEMSCFVFHASS